ncbi:protein of unknown function [Methylorubrum extorquens DM4]|uniref:Uncharacterized protein n=1 Tax=Methylorubrum extorquens (strain DSM 6343 / CIP 106787 / DM4) TaxID=661410 RepID=C7CFV0_METED|nr:protein of unknown function [Methylorubrum extorquens DM4]
MLISPILAEASDYRFGAAAFTRQSEHRHPPHRFGTEGEDRTAVTDQLMRSDIRRRRRCFELPWQSPSAV